MFVTRFNNRLRTGIIIMILLMIINLVNILFNSPLVPIQQWAQKIFYYHVPCAWVAFLSFFIVLIAGIMFLKTKNYKYDRLGLAAAELGTFFTVLVLITGPIWASAIWGKAWTWEPRLTTTFVLFLIYSGYFMLREFGGAPERVARYAAILGIIAFIDVPIIFISVRFWSPEVQSHPQVEMALQPTGIMTTFFFSLFTFTMLYFLMLWIRTGILSLKVKNQ
ncbi:MAG: cytochrome c biogenesis protein CcsA [Candidatus Marinimicrobia bacterium]|nr:cytochrome c biogenesis protein CcsA [Candidatus Neomarinimicrobiota bacterium]